MKAQRELWKYGAGERVWCGKYQNSHNLPHWHDDCELIFVEKGEVDVFCEGEKFLLKEGDGMFICGGQVHYMVSGEAGVTLVTIVFDYEIIKKHFRGLSLCSPKLCKRYPIAQIYAQLYKELQTRETYYREIAENKVESLMLAIFRGEALVKKAHTSESREQFKRLLDEIGEKYEFYTLESAAKFMSMSPAYFSRFFHAASGLPFSKYLNYVKVEAAVAALKEKRGTVTEIAVASGFGTIRNFNRAFKSLTGYAPTEIPEEFQFSAELINRSVGSEDPTLSDCELLESSSRL